MNKTRYVSVRLTEYDKARVAEAARASGLTITDWVMRLIARALKRGR